MVFLRNLVSKFLVEGSLDPSAMHSTVTAVDMFQLSKIFLKMHNLCSIQAYGLHDMFYNFVDF